MRRTGRGKKSKLLLAAADQRIVHLHDQAIKAVRAGDVDRARRYTTLAKKIGMRTTRRVPGRLRRFTCGRCRTPLVPGVNLRVRVRSKVEVFTCLECGNVMRYPFVRSLNTGSASTNVEKKLKDIPEKGTVNGDEG